MRTVLALLVLLAAPTVFAQQLPGGIVPAPTFSAFVEDPGRAFLPGNVEAVAVVVNYDPGETGRPAPAPTPERPENTQPTRITFAVKQQPSWVGSVVFDPPEVLVNLSIDPATGTSSSHSERVLALLNISPSAPALVRESFIITANAEPNGNIGGATAESPDIKLRVTTVGKLNVSAEPLTVLPGGRWTSVPFTVRNEGNSEIVAKLNVTVRPENSQVKFTDTLQLARNESKIVEVRVRVPWTNAELGTLVLEAAPIVDGEEGEVAEAEVEVRGTSAVPGVGLPLALLSLSALALSYRRAWSASRIHP